MGKSIIMIDTPKTCFDCKGYVCIENVNYCIYTHNIRYIPTKPTWCSLKEIDSEESIPIWYLDSYYTDISIGMRDGDAQTLLNVVRDWRGEKQ